MGTDQFMSISIITQGSGSRPIESDHYLDLFRHYEIWQTGRASNLVNYNFLERLLLMLGIRMLVVVSVTMK